MAGIDEIREMIEEPPDWLQEWSQSVGTGLESGLAEGPSLLERSVTGNVVCRTSVFTNRGF